MGNGILGCNDGVDALDELIALVNENCAPIAIAGGKGGAFIGEGERRLH